MDDYRTAIASLITSRDQIIANLNSLAVSLAAIPVVPNFTENGDGGSETIDNVGLRQEIMSEIQKHSEMLKQLNINIASLEAGICSTRIAVSGRGMFRY